MTVRFAFGCVGGGGRHLCCIGFRGLEDVIDDVGCCIGECFFDGVGIDVGKSESQDGKLHEQEEQAGEEGEMHRFVEMGRGGFCRELVVGFVEWRC